MQKRNIMDFKIFIKYLYGILNKNFEIDYINFNFIRFKNGDKLKIIIDY